MKQVEIMRRKCVVGDLWNNRLCQLNCSIVNRRSLKRLMARWTPSTGYQRWMMKKRSVYRSLGTAIIKGCTDGLKSYCFVLKQSKLVKTTSVLEDRIKVNDKMVIFHRHQVHDTLNWMNMCKIGKTFHLFVDSFRCKIVTICAGDYVNIFYKLKVTMSFVEIIKSMVCWTALRDNEVKIK